MADIKRLNYFNGQFLREGDFNDEQGYHIDMRRRLNRSLHTWGVADTGLQVSGTTNQISVGAGIALDSQGREIVLLTPQTKNLAGEPANSDVYVTIQYQETKTDPPPNSTDPTLFTRWTEVPRVEVVRTRPAADGAVVTLARIHLDANGNVVSPIDQSVRHIAGSKIDPGSSLMVGSLSVSGNVGIGTQSPARRLEISGTTGNLLWVGAAAGSTANVELSGHVQLREYSTQNLAYFQARDDSSNRNIGLRIRTQKAGATAPSITEALTIDGNGYVGIGTTQPSARLSVVVPGAPELSGSARSATLLTSTGGLGTVAGNELALATIGFVSNNSSSLGIRALRTTNGSGWDSTAIGIGMDVDNTIRAGASLWLHANGNVGIGTTNPQAQLHVSNYAAVGPLTRGPAIGRLEVSGASAELGFMKRTMTALPPTAAAGDRFVWYNPDGTARLWTDVKGDLLTIDMNGNILSPMWKVTTVFDYVGGPLPRTNGTFTSGGGTLLIFASGSGYRGATGGMIGMRIRIDGVERGFAQIFTNEVSSHKSFVTNSLVVGGIAAGSHTAALEKIDDLTLSDGNDRFELTVLELPFQQSIIIFPFPFPTVPPVVLNP